MNIVGNPPRYRPSSPASRSPREDATPAAPSARPREKAAQRRRARAAVTSSTSDRILGVGLTLFALYVALAGRLFYVQIVRHKEFVRTAEKIRRKDISLPARRGLLLDRNGDPLVRNEVTADVIVDPNQWFAQPDARNKETPEARQARTLETLTSLLPNVDIAAKVESSLSRPIRTKEGTTHYRTVTVAEHVPASVEKDLRDDLPSGVGLFPSTRRVAIDGLLAPHIVGFTGRDGTGLGGLEAGLKSDLKGESGILAAEFDVFRRPIPGTVRKEKPAQNGRDVVLTLDAPLQTIVQDSLGRAFAQHHAGAAVAVVLDPKTGEILACANYPTYNVNDFRHSSPESRIDRAVSLPVEPGSTLKLITAAAALEEKQVTPETEFYCNGSTKIGKYTIHCAHGERHGSETLADVVRTSCNIGTAACADKIGAATLFKYEQAFGFGNTTHSGLPGESWGMLHPYETWSHIQLANVAFGQGISVTPLQLAAAYAAIANDGVYNPPHIVWGVRDPATQTLKPVAPRPGHRVISSQTSQQLRAMLQSVVERGTGKNAQLEGYTSAGKTGTAQIPEHGHYAGKYLASFIGMAPAANPQYVILVAVTDSKDAQFGADVAAPVFKEIAEKALLAHRIPQDKAPTPASLRKAKKPERIAHDD